MIKERQEAVKTLFENQELCQDAKNILTALPDLERLLAKLVIILLLLMLLHVHS